GILIFDIMFSPHEGSKRVHQVFMEICFSVILSCFVSTTNKARAAGQISDIPSDNSVNVTLRKAKIDSHRASFPRTWVARVSVASKPMVLSVPGTNHR